MLKYADRVEMTEKTVREVIKAGANAVTLTPPTKGEIYKGMMEEYRHRYD